MLVFGTTVSSGLIGGLSAAIGVPVIFALLRKSVAYKYVGAANVVDTDDKVAGQYKRWDLVARLLFILFTGISAYLFWRTLCTLESARAALLGSADFVLTPVPVFFFLPALFAGMLFAGIPLKMVLGKIMGTEKYRRLEEYSDRRQGINSQRLGRHMMYVLIPLIVGSVLLAFQSFATVTREGLTIHPYFAFHARHYGWDEVSRISAIQSFKAPNGSVRRGRPYYVVAMRDGFQLNFHSTVLEIPFQDQRRLASFVSGHTNLPIDVDNPFP